MIRAYFIHSNATLPTSEKYEDFGNDRDANKFVKGMVDRGFITRVKVLE